MNSTSSTSKIEDKVYEDFDMEPAPLPKDVDYVDELFSINNINAAVRSVSPKKIHYMTKLHVFRDDPKNVAFLKNRLFQAESSKLKGFPNSSGPLHDITNTSKCSISGTNSFMKPEKDCDSSSFYSQKKRTPQISLQPSDVNLSPKSTSTPHDSIFISTYPGEFNKRIGNQSTPLGFIKMGRYTQSKGELHAYSLPKLQIPGPESEELSPDLHTNVSVLCSSLIEDISVDKLFDVNESPLTRRSQKFKQSSALKSHVRKATDDELAKVSFKLRSSKISSDCSPLNTSDYIKFDINDLNLLKLLVLSSEDVDLPDVEDVMNKSNNSFRFMDQSSNEKTKRKVRIYENIVDIPADNKTPKVRKRKLKTANLSEEDTSVPIISRKKRKHLASRNSTPGSIKPAIKSTSSFLTPSSEITFSDMMKRVAKGKDPIDLLN